MNKSLVPVETFTIKPVANGCITIPATQEHPLLQSLYGDGQDVNQVIDFAFDTAIQEILDVANASEIVVLEVRRFADRAEFDVCPYLEWERSVALDLAPALKEVGLEIPARWLPDGRIVLRDTAIGQSWQRFEPDGSQTMAQNLRNAAGYINSLYPDRQNTYFSLADFLEKQDAYSAGEFGRTLYRYTDCGPWTSFVCLGRKDVYYETVLAWETQEDQQWWDQCTGIEIGSIVEGSDVEIAGQYLDFPFTKEDLDATVKDIDSQADFYWQRDNSIFYTVLDADGDEFLQCQWTHFSEAPVGNFAEDDAPMLALAIAAHKELTKPNSLAQSGMLGVKVPIPDTSYFVREDNTPDYLY